MTVGQSLSKIMEFGFVHNHMLIDMFASLYGYGTKEFKNERAHFSVDLIRRCWGYNKNLILTRTFDFNSLNDRAEINMYRQLETIEKGTIFWIELHSSLKIRLKRNRTENRLKNKPSKRNIELSDKRLIDTNESFEYYCRHGNFFNNLMAIDNENKSAFEVANSISSWINERSNTEFPNYQNSVR